MLTSLLPLLLAVASAVGQSDTSFSVPAGSRLALHNLAGSVIVRPWPRSAVRIQATHPARVRVYVTREGTSYDVRAYGQRMTQPPVDYRITAPAAMLLGLVGFGCAL